MMTQGKERYGITLSSQGWSVSWRPSTYCGPPPPNSHLIIFLTAVKDTLKLPMRKHYPRLVRKESVASKRETSLENSVFPNPICPHHIKVPLFHSLVVITRLAFLHSNIFYFEPQRLRTILCLSAV